jgi:hypothetical protein
MAASLEGTSDAIHEQLKEVTYQFSEEWDARPLSAESYLAKSLDEFKRSFESFSESFGQPEFQALIKYRLDQKILNLLAEHYWNQPLKSLAPPPAEKNPLAELPKTGAESMHWQHKLDVSTSALTKLGIGRVGTDIVTDAIESHVDHLVDASTFS